MSGNIISVETLKKAVEMFKHYTSEKGILESIENEKEQMLLEEEFNRKYPYIKFSQR